MAAKLPYDAEVEYLKGDGSAFIDTGIAPTNNTRVVCRFRLGEYKATSTVFGTSRNREPCYTLGIHSSNVRIAYWFGSSTISQPVVSDFLTTLWEVDFNNNGMLTMNQYSWTLPSASFSDNKNIALLSSLDKGTESIASVYMMQIYEGGFLVRDFIPVRVGRVGYMYDRVSGQLFGNSGTGAFILGPDVRLVNQPTFLLGSKKVVVPTARDYVQNGLVFHLDSIEAGGYGVSLSDGQHPATEWKPLVGIGNVTTWNSKIMVSNGVIQNYASSYVTYTANLGRAITIENYCYRAGGNGWACNSGGYSYFGLGTLTNSRSITPVEAPAGCGNFSLESWKHMWRLASVGGRIFISNDDGTNQVEFPSNAITGTLNEDADVSTRTQYGGGSATTVNYLPFAFRVYNRILTPSEMAYNYAVDKERFGL